MALHRSYLEISTDALKHNLGVMKAMISESCQIMAVVKGNAWGAGTMDCAKIFVEGGADWLGVTTIDDAVSLRDEFDLPILLLLAPPRERINEAVARSIDISVSSTYEARQVAQATSLEKRQANVHVKVNTGLNRLGVAPKDAVSLVKELMAYDRVTVAGIFSHFSCADDPSLNVITRGQLELFNQVITDVRTETKWSGMVHMANTAATLSLPESHFDMVRIGMGLMGLNSEHPYGKAANIKQVYSWKTEVIHVIDLGKGDLIGYEGQYECPVDTTVVAIPVGWGDGLPKAYAAGGCVIIKGGLYRIVATSMDLSTIDLGRRTGEIAIGEEVVIFGRQHDKTLEPMSQGEQVGVDADATVTLISDRIPRVFR